YGILSILLDQQNPAACVTATPTPTATGTATATSTATPTPITLGPTGPVGTMDSGDSNLISASPITTGPVGAQVTALEAYIGPTTAGDRFAMAIYTDNHGPATLMAASPSQTVSGAGWNTVPLAATLAPNTTYWLSYNSSGSNDKLYFVGNATGSNTFSNAVPFGSWPATFPGSGFNGTPAYLLNAILTASTSSTATPSSTTTATTTATNTPVPPTATATATRSQSIFTTQAPAATYAGAYELGVKFQSTVAGQITGLRFYKPANETGAHVGHLWSAKGTLLGTITFTGESTSGWQAATFATPVAISANTTYVASVNSNTALSYTYYGLSTAVSNGTLATVVGNNGVYSATRGAFPTTGTAGTNYFRDVVLTTP
ncbi:MAG TPA: DUF4082 domain-containing protein, partial [Chloroflexota bacterium]|nr:DUF4082 domain-containing protein [Chloroflexota bacterium]